ncbi:MAG: glycosyltransferase family 39 protein [Acidobacteriota bacterium]
MLDLLAPVLGAVLLFGSAHLLGERMTRWLGLSLSGPAERLAVAGGLGLAALGTLGMVLGLLGGFRTPWILALLAIPVLGARIPARTPPDPPRRQGDLEGGWLRGAAYVLVGVFALANLTRALYPPTGFDALNYQLPAVARYLADGRLGFPLDLRFAAGPSLGSVLFVLAVALGGDLAAQLVSCGAGLLAALAVHAIAGRAFGRTAGACAMAVFYATPIVGWLSSEAYVDLVALLLVLIALHGVLCRLSGGSIGWVAAAGLAGGAALGTRYLAAVPIGVLLLDLLTAPQRRGGAVQRLRAAATFLALLALVCAPWYVRNAMETGNPVFPLLNDRLHGRYWGPEDVIAHRAYLQGIGPGRSPLDLLLAPVRLTASPAAFGASWTTGIGYAYLMLLPLVLARIRTSRAAPALALFALPCFVGWFVTSQQTRFLLPTLSAVAVLAGWTLQDLALGRSRARAALARGFVVLALVAAAAGGTRWPDRLPPRGQAAREAYLQRFLPGYGVVEKVNDLLPEKAVLYAFGFEGLRYYFRPRTVGDWFGPTAFREFLPGHDDRAVRRRWRELGVTHVLTRDDFPSRSLTLFRQRPYWWDRMAPLATWGDVRLYRLLDLTPPGAPRTRTSRHLPGSGGGEPAGLRWTSSTPPRTRSRRSARSRKLSSPPTDRHVLPPPALGACPVVAAGSRPSSREVADSPARGWVVGGPAPGATLLDTSSRGLLRCARVPGRSRNREGGVRFRWRVAEVPCTKARSFPGPAGPLPSRRHRRWRCRPDGRHDRSEQEPRRARGGDPPLPVPDLGYPADPRRPVGVLLRYRGDPRREPPPRLRVDGDRGDGADARRPGQGGHRAGEALVSRVRSII